VLGNQSSQPKRRSNAVAPDVNGDVREGDRGQGQALVEFALVILLLFLLLFGIIDFSRLFFAYATMSNGVREGARYGITHPPAPPDYTLEASEQEITAAAQAMMVVIGSDATIQINYPDSGSQPDPYCTHLCRIEVVATSDFPVWTPFIPNIQIETSATMHYE